MAKTMVPTSKAAAAAALAPLALLVRNPLAVLLGALAGRRFGPRGGAASRLYKISILFPLLFFIFE